MATSSQAELDDLDLVYQYLKDTQTCNYAIISSAILLIYDSILTFPREYRYIWKQSFSVVSTLHVVMRYGYMTQLGVDVAFYVWPNAPLKLCQAWFQIQLWSSFVLLFPLSVIVAMQTYAIYGQKFSFKIALTLLVAADNLAVIAGWILASKQVTFMAPFVANSTCLLRVGGVKANFSNIEYGSLAGFEAIIFFMTFFRCIQLFRTGQTRLVRNIFHDSLRYFTIMVSLTAACWAVSVGLPESRQGLSILLSAPLRVIDVILLSRIILNLREAVTASDYSVQEYTLDDFIPAPRSDT
ncbi:hypothetical protein BJ138DRAFT_379071 [Hygrophoropsis aurantiaca]|uniref:Uncharacterized protein n=1 Tax=Hygrophoropsis aurantiaca TaxID=72124 RepID=A0ACB8A5D8_9AGAM|nr:hypothetical protein BJ138DRAFT_379071 [Hygrophoropsis aurantiaca]